MGLVAPLLATATGVPVSDSSRGARRGKCPNCGYSNGKINVPTMHDRAEKAEAALAAAQETLRQSREYFGANNLLTRAAAGGDETA